MKPIPVKGYILQNEEKGSDHSHHVYITSWDGRPVHTHPFCGVTSCADGHKHEYAGVTEPAPTGVPHVHRYCTITTVEQGHKHVIQGVTGPAIPIPGGGHIHHFEGVTTVAGTRPHCHYYKGMTGKESC
ncbi:MULTISPECIES: YmaF family protein [Paenibacillus]|uniref:YmaF family protein n=1 Tax=Paenibacillus TaxID=44249 RepID=UPI001F3C9CDF|nr:MULTISPECIES: YmaF family protein [Paenibacillus]